MSLIKGVNSSYDLQEMQQLFLTVGIKLTAEELFHLLEYQYRICQKLNWVETDNKKFEKIVLPFLHSGFIHTENYMIVLKNIIYIGEKASIVVVIYIREYSDKYFLFFQ